MTGRDEHRHEHRHELRCDFDRELWRWTARADRRPGPAGVASAWLTPTLRLDVDAWDGSPLELVVDTDDDHGTPGPQDAAVLGRLLDAPLIDGGAAVVSGASFEPWSRLVRVTESARVAGAFGDSSPAWSDEVHALRESLDLSDDSAGEPTTAPVSPVSGGTESAPPLPTSEALPRLLDRPLDLGSLVDPSGRVAVDPSFVPAGILELASGGGLRWEDGGRWLLVDFPVRDDVYAPEVMGLAVVVLDGDTPVAIGVPEPGPDSVGSASGSGSARGEGGVGSGVVASVRLSLSPTRGREDLLVVVTDRPEAPPTRRLLLARAATHLARVAATAHRLGDPDAADRLLTLSIERWSAAGETRSAASRPPSEAPFLGELAG